MKLQYLRIEMHARCKWAHESYHPSKSAYDEAAPASNVCDWTVIPVTFLRGTLYVEQCWTICMICICGLICCCRTCKHWQASGHSTSYLFQFSWAETMHSSEPLAKTTTLMPLLSAIIFWFLSSYEYHIFIHNMFRFEYVRNLKDSNETK
jgi:hypothetical protein